MMISFIQTAHVVEDLAVLKIPNLERDVERSAKAVREEPHAKPRKASQRAQGEAAHEARTALGASAFQRGMA